MADDLTRYRSMWVDEMAGAALYRTLAEYSDEARRSTFESLAEAEENHAEHWAGLIRNAGAQVPKFRITFRIRVLQQMTRWFGPDAVLPMVLRAETAGAKKYRGVAEAPAAMAVQEEGHGRVVASMRGHGTGGRIAAGERRHHTGIGNAFRASIFGVSDGLVSNLALVLGMAGGTSDRRFVLLAGLAGLVAGACSMAAGEWISVRSQRELYEHEVELERAELEAFPEEERQELEMIYEAKGVHPDLARSIVDELMADPDVALDALAREELGLDPRELGSPWVAAGASFVCFALGAVVPVIPFILGSGTAAVVAAAIASGCAMFAVGALASIFTGQGPLRSGLRQTLIGLGVAAITFAIGRAVGVSV